MEIYRAIVFLLFLFASTQNIVAYDNSGIASERFEIHDYGTANVLNRHRRDADINAKVFVVPRELKNPGNQLFTVARSLKAEPTVTYRFVNGTSGLGLSIDPNTGVVSKSVEFLPNQTRIEFKVEVLVNGRVDSLLSITVHVVSRTLDDPVFSNEPVPMWAVCPVWIRPGTVVYTLKARDLEYGATDLVYALESGGEGKFGVDSTSGEVFVIGRQQFESDKVYTLLVSAGSAGATIPSSWVGYSQTLNIKVGSKEPQFYRTPYKIDFFENATSGSIVGTVRAQSFQNLPLSYTLSPTSALFAFDGSTGSLKLTTRLTHALNVRQYFFNVTVAEQYSNFVSTTTLIVTLLSINHPPEFATNHYVRYDVPESFAVENELLKMVVRDYDPGPLGQLTFNSTSDTFVANLDSTGLVSLRLAKNLDYESVVNGKYEFNIHAIDGGSPPLTGTSTVQIWVKNENNKPPVFEPAVQTITVREGAGPNLLLFYIQAYDPDGDNIRFSLDRDDSGYFEVEPSTGALTLIKRVETGQKISMFNLSVSIADDGSCCNGTSAPHVTSGNVIVNVYIVNTQPTFPECRSYRPTITEDSADQATVLDLKAVDSDSGFNGNLEFGIYGEENTFFLVNKSSATSANLILKGSVNRGTQNVLKFNDTLKLPVTVFVRDKGIPPLSSNCLLFVTITTINKYPPTFDYDRLESYIYFPSLTNGQRLARVFAYDEDFGLDGEVMYSMSVTSSDDRCKELSVDDRTGWISWTGGISIAAVQTFSCTLVASDKGVQSKSSTSTLTFILTDSENFRAPTWQELNGRSIDDTSVGVLENATLNSVVATLSASSFNGQNVNFFIAEADNLEVLNGKSNFAAVQQSTGTSANMNVVIKRALPEANLRPDFFLRCRAFLNAPDGKLVANIARLKVDVGDVNNQVPQFLGRDSNGIYTAAVTQYSKSGDYVVTVTAVDMDRDWPNNKVTYSLEEGNKDNFTIDATTGVITVQLTSSQTFDPDKKSMYEMMVVATDGAPSSSGPKPNSARVRVQITVSGGTLGSPYFNKNFVSSISEDLVRGSTVLADAKAVVPITPSGGTSSIVRYNIQQGNNRRSFAVDPDTGRIYVVRSLTKAETYRMTYAVFNGLKNNITNLTITVDPAKIYSPTFSQTTYTYSGPAILEKDPNSVGKQIATASATSKSASPVTYSSSRSADFAVDGSTGAVTLARQLSRDSPDGFAPQQVNVIADDGANPPSYSVVTLNLTDINDHAPLFDASTTVGFVNETDAINTNFMQIKAWDADFGPNGMVDFSIVEDASGNFQVSQSGYLSLSRPLSGGKQKYTLKVKATDRGREKLSNEAIITVYVNDVSTNSPSFPRTLYNVSYPEEQPVGSIVTSIEAADSDPMDQLVYNLSNAPGLDDAKFFYVESLQAFNGSYETSTAQRVSSAIVKIATRIDFDETKKSIYSFNLVVKDSSNRQSQTLVTIQIFDINDNPPVFTVPQVNVSLSEGAAIGSPVASLSATDKDSGVNGQFSFSIDYEHSDPRFMFQVNPTSGAVTIRSKLDFEWRSKMDVKILAIDKGYPPLTGTATLFVTIQNMDDSPPTLKSKIPVDPITVAPNSRKGQNVYCLDVADQGGQNNFDFQLACSDNNNQHCSDFVITPSGCLQTNRDGYANLGYGSYNIPVNITKKTGNSKPLTEVVGLTIRDPTPSAPKDGEKKVSAMNYVGSNGGFSAMPLGTVFVASPGSLDPMQFALDPGYSYFYMNGPKVWLKGNATAGEHVANVKVTDSRFRGTTGNSKVNVNVKHINESFIKSATSLRIIGLRDAKNLLQMNPSGQGTFLDALAQRIGELVGAGSVVEILSVWTVEGSYPTAVDVLYAVHGSPFYAPEKISSLVWSNRADISQKTQLTISMSPVDLCRSEFNECWGEGCETRLMINETQPRLIDGEAASFVGVTAEFKQICACASRTLFNNPGPPVCDSGSCLNGGTCMLNNSVVRCLCPAGFDGRRCQKTSVSLRNGYLLLPPLSSCQVDHLTFDFLAINNPQNSLLLYNGPISDPGSSLGTFEEISSPTYQPPDFLLLELVSGRPRLKINLGDGEVVLAFDAKNLASLVDNKWHSIDIIHNGTNVQMMVDKCGKANLTENINQSTMDTSTCEVRGNVPKERFLLNTMAPLQVGGRWDSSNPYPQNWIKDGFVGCIKNLQHNGEAYDLSLGSWRQFANADGSCPGDQCGSCPQGGRCIPDVMTGGSICQCPYGFRGPACNIRTTVKYFEQNGYALWTPTDAFKQTHNASMMQSFWFADRIHLSFRTRQMDGVLYAAQSFTGLERYLLEVKAGTLSFAFDLGSGDQILTLPNVGVADGAWHQVLVIRYGNLVEMHLDAGDAGRYNVSLPTNDHRLLRINSANALGEVDFNSWTKSWTVSKSLGKSCVTDVRYGGYWWPLSEAENSEADVTTRVALVGSSDTGCSVGECQNNCPPNQVCVDLWQSNQCVCKNYLSPFNAPPTDPCTAKSCATSPCRNGGTCAVVDGRVTCVCPPGWFGFVCDSLDPNTGESTSSRNFNLAAAIVLPIIFGLLLLLLLILLLWWCCCRKKKDHLLYDEPDKDIRENVISYDDEGAGEEDNYAFDLSRLQKSSPLEAEMLNRAPDLTNIPAFTSRAGAGRPLPGDYPSIADFIADRLNDIDNNPDTNGDDSRVNFDFEGQGSQAGTLSSLASSDGDRNVDFDWLEGVGPRFGRLADLYGEGGQV